MPMDGLAGDLLVAVAQYKLSLAITLLQWSSVGLRARRTRGSPATRAPTSTYWFLPVFAWGVDSAILVLRYFTGDIGYFPSPVWVIFQAIVATVVLATLVASSIAAETAAKAVGLPARHAVATVPLPVLAAIASGCLVWGLMFVMILPLPRGRELTIGSRIPCLPDESVDDGTGRVLTGCRFWNGNAEFFVGPDRFDAARVGYIEVADSGFVTREGLRVGSRLEDVLRGGGARPSLRAARLCVTDLRSGWSARFDTVVCSEGTEERPEGVVRRLVMGYR